MTKKRKKFQYEILEVLFIVSILAVFFFGFFYITSNRVLMNYALDIGYTIDDVRLEGFQIWRTTICILAAGFIYIGLLLFFLGQKTVYITTIIENVKSLRGNNLDTVIPVEGENELTTLAENINYMSASVKEHMEKEQQLKREREELVRALSHDIRTPLTSIISYTDYMIKNGHFQDEKLQDYTQIIQRKAAQIQERTDRLLQKENSNQINITGDKLLLAQLTEEWESILEEQFEVKVNCQYASNFQGGYPVHEMRRIFDNLISNVQKYADSSMPVELEIEFKEQELLIQQKNHIAQKRAECMESHKIGLQNLHTIVKEQGGSVEVKVYNHTFEIKLVIPVQKPL